LFGTAPEKGSSSKMGKIKDLFDGGELFSGGATSVKDMEYFANIGPNTRVIWHDEQDKEYLYVVFRTPIPNQEKTERHIQ
jgi:hypothetical protein